MILLVLAAFTANVVRRSGGGDVRVRFSTILKGGKALAPKEFAARKPEALIGASVLVVVPTGQYDPQRLVNPGHKSLGFQAGDRHFKTSKSLDV